MYYHRKSAEKMAENLTDKEFWLKFWETKQDQTVQTVPANIAMHKLFDKVLAKYSVKTAIELGGFPGQYPIFLKKFRNIDTTLLDYVIYWPLFKKMLSTNGLTEKDIPVIEADLFNYTPTQTYDMVYSLGLIEHFTDMKDIIGRHLQFLKPGGALFILLPNFTGVNGAIQKNFDRPLYDVHNIACMDIDVLTKACQQLGLKDIDVKYDGGFSVWLDDPEKKSALLRAGVKTVWFAGKVFSKIFRFESKLLSPYITITATK